MHFSLIIPTYNERENILVLIKRLQKILKPYDYEIIVVDDDSPDKTWELVQNKYSKNKRVRIIRRMNEKGLSSAICRGFDNARGKILGVIDADLQHDPGIIPKMLREADKHQLVVGSRYVKNGGVEGWPFIRLAGSRLAAWLANILLGIKIRDNGAGFFMVKKEAYKRARPGLFKKGYRLLLDISFNAGIKDFKELPYVFRQRKKGSSKLSPKVAFQYLAMLIMFMFRKHLRFIKFCLVGFSGALVNLGLLYVLTEFAGLYYLVSGIIAIEASILTNFILHNAWTWRDRRKKSATLKRFFKYNLVSVSSLVINAGLLYILTSLAGVYYIVSNIAGIIAAALWNFFINHYWTFKKHSPENNKK